MRTVICGLGFTMLAALLPTVAANAAGDIWTVSEITYTTDFGLRMHGRLHAPAGEGATAAPLIVTLPMLGTTHTTYDPFIDSLAAYLRSDTGATVPYVLAVDLRGHGASTQLGDITVSYKTMDEEQWAPVPNEVAGFVRHVVAEYPETIDAEQITLIGASIGANAAVMATVQLEGVTAVALLSPGSNYRGLQPAKALGAFDGRVLLFAARDDSYAAESAERLSQVNNETNMRMFSGSRHGTEILNAVPGAMRGLLDWLLE